MLKPLKVTEIVEKSYNDFLRYMQILTVRVSSIFSIFRSSQFKLNNQNLCRQISGKLDIKRPRTIASMFQPSGRIRNENGSNKTTLRRMKIEFLRTLLLKHLRPLTNSSWASLHEIPTRIICLRSCKFECCVKETTWKSSLHVR